MSDDHDARMEGWGMTYALIQDDEGVKAAANLAAAVASLTDSSISVKDRKDTIGSISYFSMVVEKPVKIQPMIDTIPAMCSAIETIMLMPNDDVKKEDYDDHGLQMLAEQLADVIYSLSGYPNMEEYGEASWGPAIDLLAKVDKVEYKKGTPLKGAGPAVSRYEAIFKLLRTGPAWGSKVIPPANAFDVAKLYSSGPCSDEAGSLLQKVMAANPKAAAGQTGSIFDSIRAGDTSCVATLVSNYTTMYAEDPAAFETNIDVILKLDFSASSGILYAMASGISAKVLAGHTEHLVALLESKTIQHGSDSMVVTILNGCAEKAPEKVLPFMDRIYACGIALAHADTSLAMLIGNLGKAPGASERVVVMLGTMLSEPTLGPHTPRIILDGISNQFDALGDNTKVLEPFMPQITALAGSAGIVVEKIIDWYEGRSLKKTDAKVDALEAKVNAMNDAFASQCKNFKEVSAMMDKKIAEVKDFVGEIVKKLPQPCKLEVVGGLRKSLLLHFACARTGQTVTTETKDWNQWCKVGFGLIKLGKCVAVAAAGNPMALASGAGAIADIYKGYKTKDDADFNTFISQPFLTSAESDKLINQLRAANFFDKMAYDAQAGDWCLVSALTEEELAKRDGKKAATNATKANVVQTKGANMGLGTLSLGEAGTLVGAVADGAGTVSGVAGSSSGSAIADAVGTHAGYAEDAPDLPSLPKGYGKKAAAGPDDGRRVSAGASDGIDMGDVYAKKKISPAAASTPPKKRGLFGGMFGSSPKASTSAAATGNSLGGMSAEESERVAALEARVALLEAQVQALLKAAEKTQTAKRV